MKILKISTLLAATTAFAGPTIAQNAPDLSCDTVRVVVGFPPGGGSDYQARVLVDAANEIIDGPELQVVNISGQSGNRGSRDVVESDPDGCTMMFHLAAILSSYFTGRVPYSWEAFEPVAMISREPATYAASNNDNFTNLDELAAYASENPGEVTAAVSMGSDSHFFALQLQDALGVEFNIVGYNGEAERVTALLSDVVQLAQVTEQTAAQYFGNELTALAYMAEERSPRLPDVPTGGEQGYDLDLAGTRGFLLPAETPDEIVDYYADVFRQVLDRKDVVEELESKGMIIDYRGPAEYREWWQTTSDEWENLAKDFGVYNPRD